MRPGQGGEKETERNPGRERARVVERERARAAERELARAARREAARVAKEKRTKEVWDWRAARVDKAREGLSLPEPPVGGRRIDLGFDDADFGTASDGESDTAPKTYTEGESETPTALSAFWDRANGIVGQDYPESIVIAMAVAHVQGPTELPATLADALDDETWLRLFVRDLAVIEEEQGDATPYNLLCYIIERWSGESDPVDVLERYIINADDIPLDWGIDVDDVAARVAYADLGRDAEVAPLDPAEADAAGPEITKMEFDKQVLLIGDPEYFERVLSRFDAVALELVGTWYERHFHVRMDLLGELARTYRDLWPS